MPVVETPLKKRWHPRLSIRTWMLLTSVLAAVPSLLLTALMMQRIAANQQLEDQHEVRQRTAAAALAVKERLDRAVAVLQAVAASDAALRGDVAALHAHARRIAATHPYDAVISLSRADGSILLSTQSPLDVSLPASAAAPLERAVFTDAQPVITPVFQGAITGRMIVLVAVPLLLGSQEPLSLRMSLPTDAVKAVLAGQRWPEQWIVSVIDQRGAFVARVPELPGATGTLAAESLREAIAQGRQDLFDAVTRDNTHVIGHAAPVPGTGWHVAVGVPQELFHEELRRTFSGLLVAGIACLALGTIGAVAVSRVVSRQIRQLVQSPTGAVNGHKPTTRPSLVAEVEVVSGVLADALDKQQALHDQLASARLDALTGLATRQLFSEQAAAMMARRHADSEHSVAVLFVDLDGFKSINDEQGHEVGDAVLAQVAQAIRHVVRVDDVVGRFGGDEFVICLCADRSSIQTICRSVAARLIEQVNAIGYGLGCSIGIATTSGAAQSLDRLLTAADTAMLQAKRAGKNTFVFGDDAAAGAAPDRPGSGLADPA